MVIIYTPNFDNMYIIIYNIIILLALLPVFVACPGRSPHVPNEDVLVGSGTGGSRVTAYAGTALTAGGSPATLRDFDAFPGFTGGVFVG